MASKTIVIACDDEGNYSVAEKGMEGMGMDGMGMQPVEGLDQALEMAREMFADDPEADMEADKQFESGYGKAGGDSLMMARMGGMKP